MNLKELLVWSKRLSLIHFKIKESNTMLSVIRNISSRAFWNSLHQKLLNFDWYRSHFVLRLLIALFFLPQLYELLKRFSLRFQLPLLGLPQTETKTIIFWFSSIWMDNSIHHFPELAVKSNIYRNRTLFWRKCKFVKRLALIKKILLYSKTGYITNDLQNE